MKKVFLILCLLLLVSCSKESDIGFNKVSSTSSVKIDSLEEADHYFIYYSFDVKNDSYVDLNFYVDLLPQDEQLRKLIGKSYRVKSFKNDGTPQSFTVLSGEESTFGFTVSIPKSETSYDELEKMAGNYTYRFTNETYTAEYSQ